MPELPEVESFRRLLLPLVVASVAQNVTSTHDDDVHLSATNQSCLKIDSAGAAESNPNRRIRLNSAEREEIARNYACTNIVRKGKQLCLVLSAPASENTLHVQPVTENRSTKYLFLHMGMTGQIRVEGKEQNWGDKKISQEENPATNTKAWSLVPPKYTLLIFRANNYTAYFCDPRKFGSCYLADDCSALDELAPDALDYVDAGVNNESNILVQERILSALCHQKRGIKAILLDQKRVVSGVGNWVADEVLYQCHLHPDQTMLTHDEALCLCQTLQSILRTAVQCLVHNDTHYPEDWLFGYRWTKGKQSSGNSKDAFGRTITFLQSGGRTSAVVATIQKLDKQRSKPPKQTISKPTEDGDDSAYDTKTVAQGKEATSANHTPSRKRKAATTDIQQFRHKKTDSSTINTEMASESSVATQLRRSSRLHSSVVTPP